MSGTGRANSRQSSCASTACSVTGCGQGRRPSGLGAEEQRCGESEPESSGWPGTQKQEPIPRCRGGFEAVLSGGGLKSGVVVTLPLPIPGDEFFGVAGR